MGGSVEARSELQEETIRKLVEAVGCDRAMDFIWAGNTAEYPVLARLVKENNLARSVPAQVLQLAAETGYRAQTIHRDPSLPIEQKRQFLVTLQQEVRPLFDGLIPPDLQQKLPAATLAWINLLGEGGYRFYPTSITGRNMGGTGSIEQPAPRLLPPPPRFAGR